MVKVVAQRGPLGVNVNSILWHDYVSEYFCGKKLPLLRFGQNLRKCIPRNFLEYETREISYNMESYIHFIKY